jgi:hypothetical protein
LQEILGGKMDQPINNENNMSGLIHIMKSKEDMIASVVAFGDSMPSMLKVVCLVQLALHEEIITNTTRENPWEPFYQGSYMLTHHLARRLDLGLMETMMERDDSEPHWMSQDEASLNFVCWTMLYLRSCLPHTEFCFLRGSWELSVDGRVRPNYPKPWKRVSWCKIKRGTGNSQLPTGA